MNNMIYPGKVCLDTSGKRIQAHGASIFYENGVFYWYGEDKSHTRKKGKLWTWGIRCYSSIDLYNWKDEGHMIPPKPDDKSSILHPNRRMDRPHILKNHKTNKYVCWLKFCDKSHFSILTADNLLGPYRIVKEFFQPFGKKCGDFDLVVDEGTGQGYLYVETDHRDLIVVKLSEDFTDIQGDFVEIYKDIKPPFTREGVTHFERNGKHYLLTSGMTGYVPNPSEVAVADDWMGPYTIQGNPHVKDESCASFNSQVSAVFQHPQKKDLYIAIADRWVPEFAMTKDRYDVIKRVVLSNYDRSVKASMKERLSLLKMPMMGSADTSIANYVWLPIRFEGDKVYIDWKDSWSIEEYENSNKGY